jgi:hypothetical protein
VTLRVRAGGEIGRKIGKGRLSMLGEVEGTLALDDSYNAFPFGASSEQRRPTYPVVPDPESIDLNRLQIQYASKGLTVTVGRQRINLDDQRFVGSVAWRQNEQTFDAVRGEAKLGPVMIDATYALSQRTIFGSEAGERAEMGGDFVLLGAGVKRGPVTVKGFAYLLDYDETFALASSSQTYGVRAAATLSVAKGVKLGLTGSYARQSDYGRNPHKYSADYVLAEVSVDTAGFRLTGGYELLGSDAGANVAMQTPMATLHKFNGWADKFLTTPTTGLQDGYGGVGYSWPKLGGMGPLALSFTYHRFDSDRGSIHYGDEYDAQATLKLNTHLTALVKYADFQQGDLPAYRDTRKIWAQIDYAL